MNVFHQARLGWIERVAASTMVSPLIVFGCLAAFSALSCLNGTYYDDEISSIAWATLPFPNILESIGYFNSHDIHPPASYLFNKFAFDALGNWKAVKFVNGALNAASIAWFHRYNINHIAQRERIVLTFVLATAVTSEMWGTGLRWNAYFNPIFLVLYTVALSNWLSVTGRAAVLGAGTVLLFHTSYLTIVAAPVLWGVFFVRAHHDLRPSSVAPIALILFAVVVACLPQLYVMLTAHWSSYVTTHSFSILYSIAQSVSTLALGTAVFPIDYIPVLFLSLLAAAFVSSLKKNLHDDYVQVLFGSVLLGLILLIVTRVGIEGRNAVFLYPIALVLIAIAISRAPKLVRYPAMAVLVLFQLTSVYNFVFHHDTSKGSFNAPFARAMAEISGIKSGCLGTLHVFTRDPVLSHLMLTAGENVSSPYARSTSKTISVRKDDCVVVVHTFRAAPVPDLIALAESQLRLESFQKLQATNLEYDRFHAIKSWLSGESYPDYYITIDVYRALRDATLSDWFFL